MINYPIIQKGECTNKFATDNILPNFYMEDFSILGLRVDNCSQAEKVLSGEGFSIDRQNNALTITFEKAAKLENVIKLLNKHGVECEIADIADGMYQG